MLNEQEKNDLLGKLFDSYHGIILNTILKVLGDENAYMAEDCLGQTFMIACKKKDKMLSRERPVVWLMAVGKNCARRYRRDAEKERSRFVFDEEIVSNIEDKKGEFLIDDIVYRDWMKNGVLQKLIDELHPRTRQAFIAKYIDGKTNAEIAAEMKVTESTVRTFLSDARKHIEKRVRSGKI